jgi:hypothetical protein
MARNLLELQPAPGVVRDWREAVPADSLPRLVKEANRAIVRRVPAALLANLARDDARAQSEPRAKP